MIVPLSQIEVILSYQKIDMGLKGLSHLNISFELR